MTSESCRSRRGAREQKTLAAWLKKKLVLLLLCEARRQKTLVARRMAARSRSTILVGIPLEILKLLDEFDDSFYGDIAGLSDSSSDDGDEDDLRPPGKRQPASDSDSDGDEAPSHREDVSP